MYFPSKKDKWFFFFTWGFIFFLIFMYIFGGEPVGYQFVTYKSVPGYIISALIIVLLVWIWFGTGYKVEEGYVKVKSGPFKSKVKIEEIRKISKTKSPFTAPSLSVDRLEILFGKYDVVHISPKNESKFIRTLLAENPTIQIDEKIVL